MRNQTKLWPEYPDLKIKLIYFLFSDHKREEFNSRLKKKPGLAKFGRQCKNYVSPLGNAIVTDRNLPVIDRKPMYI